MTHAIDTSALVALSGRRRLELIRACCEHVAVPVAIRVEGGGWVMAGDQRARREGEQMGLLHFARSR